MNNPSPMCIWPVTARRPVAVGPAHGTDHIPLTERGEDNARLLRERLAGITFSEVLVSPLQRPRRTCDLAGFGPSPRFSQTSSSGTMAIMKAGSPPHPP